MGMIEKLETALKSLAKTRDTLSVDAQTEIALTIEAFVSEEGADPADFMTAEQIAELDRRLSRPSDPVDSAEVNAFFEQHGLQSNF